MRIMVDSNIVISALFFPNGRVSAIMRAMFLQHSVCIASFALDEIGMAVRRKFPGELHVFDAFLTELPYEIIRTSNVLTDIPEIRDPKDRPILATAISGDVDVLLTGDKDFLDVELTRPRIMTPAQFAAEHLWSPGL